jgi:predicted metal-dependent phosphoesterase TrpH
MMLFETHIHTKEVSPCADCSAAEAVLRCVRLGYGGMAVTDHFAEDTHRRQRKTAWQERVSFFLSGYRAALAAAPGGFTVLLGMEVRFTGEGNNDYLVFGVHEGFLRSHRHFDRLGVARFGELAREQGLLVFQAHPFRVGMTITQPRHLDGVEVYNGNSHHESHNAIAAAWAQACGLKAIAGSDYHGGDTGDGMAPGGVELCEPVRDNADFVRALRDGTYKLAR